MLAALAMRHLRRPLRTHRQNVIAAAASVSAVVAAFAPAEPTGWAVLDVLCRVSIAFLIPPAASLCAYGWVVSGIAVLAVGSYADTERIVPSVAAAAGVAVVLAIVGAGNRALQAVAGALAAIGLLHLDGPSASTSLGMGLLVVALLTLPAIPALGSEARRRVVVVSASVASVAAVLAMIGWAALASARAELEEGVDLAVEGLDVLGEDDDYAAALLETAARRFASADATLRAWWTRPALAAPVVAQHVRAAATVADVGEQLAGLAATTVNEVDLGALYLRDGTVDLATVRAVAGPAASVAAGLDASFGSLRGADSPWLLTTLRDQLRSVAERLGEARTGARTVAQVSEVLPSMLGGEGPRRYLLLLQNPAETRGSGGMPGNFAEVVADGGDLELVRTGRLRELIDGGIPRSERVVDVPAHMQELYVGADPAGIRWQVTTTSPDFEDTATLVGQLYPQSGGSRVDGVIGLDPIAFDLLLGVTGPVFLPEAGVSLQEGEAAPFFLHDQYASYDERDERGDRIDMLDDAVERIWDALTSGRITSLRELAAALATGVDGRNIQFVSFHPDELRALRAAGITGRLPPLVADGVGAVMQSGSANKIDWFVDRDTRYEARWDPDTGEVTGTYRVRVTNRAPAAGEPDAVIAWGGSNDAPQRTRPGEALMSMRLYTALPPVGLRVDGERAARDTRRHGDWYVTVLLLRVPSQETGSVDLEVAGQIPPGSPYDLAVIRQTSINGDDFGVIVDVAGGTEEVTPLGAARRLDNRRVVADERLDAPFSFAILPH